MLNVNLVGYRNQVSVAETSEHTIAGNPIPKSTNHKCSPLFRSLAHLSSGQKMSCQKTQTVSFHISFHSFLWYRSPNILLVGIETEFAAISC